MKPVRLIALLAALAALAALGTWHLATRDSLAQAAGGYVAQEPTSDKFDAARKAANRPQLWVEAIFIQINTAELDTVKASLDNTLDALTGTIMLTGEGKKELLTALRAQPSCEILGSASLVSIAEQSALMQFVEEVRYPTEYKAQVSKLDGDERVTIRASEAVVVPGTFETRDVGMRLNVTPLVSADGKTITLVLLPEVSLPAGWINFGSKTFSQPVFTSWTMTTTLCLNDGQTVVLTGVPTKNFEHSAVVGPQVAERSKVAKSSVLIISAKTIKTENER